MIFECGCDNPNQEFAAFYNGDVKVDCWNCRNYIRLTPKEYEYIVDRKESKEETLHAIINEVKNSDTIRSESFGSKYDEEEEDSDEQCPRCHGHGKVYDEPCRRCDAEPKISDHLFSAAKGKLFEGCTCDNLHSSIPSYVYYLDKSDVEWTVSNSTVFFSLECPHCRASVKLRKSIKYVSFESNYEEEVDSDEECPHCHDIGCEHCDDTINPSRRYSKKIDGTGSWMDEYIRTSKVRFWRLKSFYLWIRLKFEQDPRYYALH